MAKIQFRNDSAGTIYLDSFGHQQILVSEVIDLYNQETKLKGDSQITTLLNAGDLVLIDDTGTDRTAAEALKILGGTVDLVKYGGASYDLLCTDPSGDITWSAGSVLVKEEGTLVNSIPFTTLNFIGPAITATDATGRQTNITVVALQNIVEDTTPQLGGMLDVNTFGVGDGTNLLLDFVEDASAVNHIQIENEATGSGPIIRAVGTDTNIDLVLIAKGTGVIDASTSIISNVVDPVAAQDAATKNYVDNTVSSGPTGLDNFHEVWSFYEQGSTGDIYMMRADSLVSKKNPGHIALANGRIVHVTSTREKSPEKYCDIVIRKQTASGTVWLSGSWTNVGTALLMNNTILSDTYTNLTGYTFNAGDAISVYLDKTTPAGGASCESPFVGLYVKYD